MQLNGLKENEEKIEYVGTCQMNTLRQWEGTTLSSSCQSS